MNEKDSEIISLHPFSFALILYCVAEFILSLEFNQTVESTKQVVESKVRKCGIHF